MTSSTVPQLHLVHSEPSVAREVEIEVESPLSRLIERGPAALVDAELVAVLLGDGSLPAARDLLERAGGVRGLGSTSGLASGAVPSPPNAHLSAAVELARRMARAEVPVRRPMSQPAKVAAYLERQYCRAGQEVMGALFLDARQRLLADRELFRGTLERATVEPGPILREALLIGAAGVVLFHSHPSGDAAPSREDMAFTRRFARAGEVMGVRLVDHVIVASGGDWFSFAARGGW